MRRLLVAFSLLLALGLLVPQSTFAADGPARVRIAHASPDAPAVDVFVDGQSVLTNVTFFTVSDYLQVQPGTHRFQIAPTGKGAANAVIDTTVDLTSAEEYTVMAVGRLAAIQPLVLSDSSETPPAGKALIRVVQAAPEAGTVDIKFANSDGPFLTEQYFKSADYVAIDPGDQTFEVAPSGTENVFLITPKMRFEAGWTYTLYLTGVPGGSPQAWLQASVDRFPQSAE